MTNTFMYFSRMYGMQGSAWTLKDELSGTCQIVFSARSGSWTTILVVHDPGSTK
jgi:hypothetical protein